jgi:hypothetical protein
MKVLNLFYPCVCFYEWEAICAHVTGENCSYVYLNHLTFRVFSLRLIHVECKNICLSEFGNVSDLPCRVPHYVACG